MQKSKKFIKPLVSPWIDENPSLIENFYNEEVNEETLEEALEETLEEANEEINVDDIIKESNDEEIKDPYSEILKDL